jgi:hypothetical protein
LEQWYINTITDFSDIIHHPALYLQTAFCRLDSVSIFQQKPKQLVPINTASPYFQTGTSSSDWAPMSRLLPEDRDNPVSKTLFLKNKQDDG